MDTTTVLEIIKIIDNQIDYYRRNNSQDGFGNIIKDFPQGQEDSLVKLSSHLQSFIEGQLNATELQSGE
jgi:hypothetical protein